MATTGSILAAIEAGMMPEIIPKMIQILSARLIILGAIKIGKGNTADSPSANSQTNNNPTNPPIIHKNALSIKNSVSIVLLFAPNAFFNDFFCGLCH